MLHIFLVTVNITLSDSNFPYFLLDTEVDEAACNVSKIKAFQGCRSEHVHGYFREPRGEDQPPTKRYIK
jgi:hypothetical protein